MNDALYYRELPEGWKEEYAIDAKDKKTIVIMQVAAFLLMILIGGGLSFLASRVTVQDFSERALPAGITAIISMIAYIVLHELTHGLVYKLYTKEKLTFGLTLTVAYCGVPDLYVSKKVAFLAVIAPFVVFNLVFAAPLFFITSMSWFLAFSLLLTIHVSGCVGDLYVAYIILTKFRGRPLLMNDTGPKQTFYGREA